MIDRSSSRRHAHRRRRALLAFGVAYCLLALAGCTSGSSKGSDTTAADASVASTDTAATESTHQPSQPATTEPTSAVPPETSAPVSAVPPDAEQLGFGTYVPVPDDWIVERVDANTVFFHQSDAVESNAVYLSVAKRPVNEDPRDYVAAYVHELDRRLEHAPISFARSRPADGIGGEIAARVIEIPYTPYNAATPNLFNEHERPRGDIFVYQRADGLAAIYDTIGGSVPSDNSKHAFEKTFAAVPAIGPSGDIEDIDPFVLESPSNPRLHVTDSLSFTAAAGFTELSSEIGVAISRADGCRFIAAHLTGLADAAAAQEEAASVLNTFEPGALVLGRSPLSVGGSGQIVSSVAIWEGSSDGAGSEGDNAGTAGDMFVVFDMTSHNAVVNIGADSGPIRTLDCQSDIEFMRRSLENTLQVPIG